jgi:chorismate dehydratase
MWDFERGDAGGDFEIEYTVPSACAAALAANHADIGIIPAFTYAEIPDLSIIPDIAIAAKDRVRSILLVSPKDIRDVQTVAADTSSRTSVALLQVLFSKFLGGPRELRPCAPNLREMLRGHDAALLIGDAALQVPEDAGYRIYDLARLWREFTGCAFVFAFWAVRNDSLERKPAGLDLTGVFQQSRNRGLQPASIASIAEEWSPRLGIGRDVIREYLTENIHYYLDAESCAGLQRFFELSREIGLIENHPELKFLRTGE